jgi:3-hydroxyacyl-CoA dehydrogenase/enoyl-CoA hydratase/3-hydroxybutyryl-CoA epimerase/enoyl-CoA isomerase
MRRRKSLPAFIVDDESSWDAVNSQAKKAMEHQHLPAAHVALGMIRKAIRLERDAALVCEASHFPEVAQSPQAAALLRVYSNEQDVKRQARRWVSSSTEILSSIGVAGAGTMGSGLALAAATYGSQVQVADVSSRALESGASYVRKQLERQTKTGKRSASDQQAIEQKIRWQATFEGWETCDLAVEAVVEDLKTKVGVLQGIEARVTPQCVIATNTSSLLVTDLAREMENPERFVGLHFFNPVPAMPLVEVVRTVKTSPLTLARATSWVRQMRKTPIVVADCPGFLVNRIITPYLRSFIGLVAEGIDPYRIDRLMQNYGWPMGPATLEDVIGLDTGARVLDIIAAGYIDRMPPQDSNILHQLAQQGWLGRKSGSGFYDYSSPVTPQPNPKAVDFIVDFQAGRRLELDDQAIVDRMMLPLWLEAALCLREGVVQTAAEIDMALLMGLGYPRYLGGALYQIDQVGWPRIETMVTSPRRLGQEYRLPERWQDLFGAGSRFYP